MGRLSQSETSVYYKVRQVFHSAIGITKWDDSDKVLLGITKWDDYHKVGQVLL